MNEKINQMRYVVDEQAWNGYVVQVRNKDVLKDTFMGRRNLKDILKSTHRLLEKICDEENSDKVIYALAQTIESSLMTLRERTGITATMGNFLKQVED